MKKLTWLCHLTFDLQTASSVKTIFHGRDLPVAKNCCYFFLNTYICSSAEAEEALAPAGWWLIVTSMFSDSLRSFAYQTGTEPTTALASQSCAHWLQRPDENRLHVESAGGTWWRFYVWCHRFTHLLQNVEESETRVIIKMFAALRDLHAGRSSRFIFIVLYPGVKV